MPFTFIAVGVEESEVLDVELTVLLPAVELTAVVAVVLGVLVTGVVTVVVAVVDADDAAAVEAATEKIPVEGDVVAVSVVVVDVVGVVVDVVDVRSGIIDMSSGGIYGMEKTPSFEYNSLSRVKGS